MKKGWKVEKLGEVALVGAGNSAPQKKEYFEEGAHLFIRTADVGRIRFGEIAESKDKLNSKGIEKLKEWPPGTILVPKSGASTWLNHRVIMKKEGYVSSHLSTVKAHEEMTLDRFLLYCLQNVKAQDLIQDHKYPSLKLSDIKQIPIPIPPLSEQEEIVEVLDKAFAAIDQAKANIEQNIANAKELFQSKLNQIFSQKGEGWVETTLPEAAAEFGRGKSKHRPRNAEFLYGGPYPFVQTGDIRNSGQIISSFEQTYTEEGLAQSKLWPSGTICITIAANIAETGILGFEGCFPDSVIGMIPDPEFTSAEYVEYLLRFFKVELQALGKGAAQDNINLGTFKNRKFPFAPLPQQKAIVTQLDALSESTNQLASHYQTKLASLDELKKSILQKAFAGELT